jgi:pentatricopeptide repeat protein
MAGSFMVASLTYLWGIAWLTCMQNVGAWRMLGESSTRCHLEDVVTWNTMILGCVKCRKCQEALELFRQIEWEGVQPDFVTSVGVLNACASVVALEEGSCVHKQIIRSG